MSDLVERLRAGVQNDGYHFLTDEADALMKEAADEIERLRARAIGIAAVGQSFAEITKDLPRRSGESD